MQKPAITQAPINEVIAKRWSPRAFDASKVVSHEQLIALLEAAHWAPSCFGDEPWRFIVWNKSIDESAWQQAFDCLAPSNQTWVKHAPLLILVCANNLFGHNQTPNRWGQYDTGAAAENLCLQASSMGLAAHQMGGFNSDLAREKFAIPAQYTPMSMLAVGYEGDANSLPDDLKARELAERKRKPLGELFFEGAWDKPIKA
ncbi:MAG: nitroreductase family protein [Bdellovibrio sp.]|nr:nitroreductase family protein [Methylotenera sp.]